MTPESTSSPHRRHFVFLCELVVGPIPRRGERTDRKDQE